MHSYFGGKTGELITKTNTPKGYAKSDFNQIKDIEVISGWQRKSLFRSDLDGRINRGNRDIKFT